MAELTVRKCGGCGAPLPPGTTVCEFCNVENIDDSGDQSGVVFDVMLTRVGAKLIYVIKVIREITHLGLKESKGLADNVPSVIKRGVTRSEADEFKGKLEEVGASVEIMNTATRVPVYQTPVTAASSGAVEEAEKKSGPGCLMLIGIILLVVFVM